MKRFFGSMALLVVALSLHQPAMATYYLEVESVSGVNMMQVNLWADGDELVTPVNQATAQINTFDFAGNIDGTNVTFQSLAGLSGFLPFSPTTAGQDFTAPISYTVFAIGGLMLPSSANSPEDALPIMTITYNSSAQGSFKATVLDPTDSQGTVVNGPNLALTSGSTTGPVTLSAIPEPSSFILVGLMAGLGYGCVWLRRRRADNAE